MGFGNSQLCSTSAINASTSRSLETSFESAELVEDSISSEIENDESFETNGMLRTRHVSSVPYFTSSERDIMQRNGKFWPGFFDAAE